MTVRAEGTRYPYVFASVEANFSQASYSHQCDVAIILRSICLDPPSPSRPPLCPWSIATLGEGALQACPNKGVGGVATRLEGPSFQVSHNDVFPQGLDEGNCMGLTENFLLECIGNRQCPPPSRVGGSNQWV